MRFFRTLIICVAVVLPAAGARSPGASQGRLPVLLVRLASRAKSPRGWPELRRYAASRKNAKDRALGYFVLGYREYQSGDYATAEEDLARASSSDSPFADLAEYYEAAAAYKGGHPERIAGILGAFTKHYPSSVKHFGAIQLLAEGYLNAGQPQIALRVLISEPDVRVRPALALLLARAYADNRQPEQAALIYQDIYYAYPTAPEAEEAGNALKKLKLQLGVSFPPVTDEIATARVEKLYVTHHYSKALKGYEHLLKKRNNSKWAWQWNLGRAMCLIRLGRADDAIDTLAHSNAPTSELDAERLAILVDAYARTDNDAEITKTINRLEMEHFKSRWRAVALLRAANYFMYEGEWKIAPLYYSTLQKLFPNTPQGSEASWRLAWITYLTGKPDQAQASLLRYIKNYPDSPYVQAAIYFLGRLEENREPAEARALYDLLRKRFLHSYYAQEAARRLSVMNKVRVEERSSGSDAIPFSVSALAIKIPPVDPIHIETCTSTPGGRELVDFKTLAALHLDKLAEQDLLSRLERHPDSVHLIFALSQFEAKRGRTDRALQMTKRIIPDYRSQQFSELPREIWQLLFPKAYMTLIRRYAVQYHLNLYLVMGLIRQESAFNARATSPADARGLMQVLASSVARTRRYRRIVARRLYAPAYNLRAGCTILRGLLKRYHGNAAEALAAYNAGPSRVDQWLGQRSYHDQQEFVESIPFPTTRVYVKAVFADSGIYRQLTRGSPKFAECSDQGEHSRRRSEARLQTNLSSRAHPLLTDSRSSGLR